ncbi:hypothetical protein R69927_07493 [Paraburkholderia domus]|nr:hypothetical protein [Burkholderia sp. R-69927]CAE6937322.1 hypothetical protein R69927_07493 [Paraburkholderia domus]
MAYRIAVLNNTNATPERPVIIVDRIDDTPLVRVKTETGRASDENASGCITSKNITDARAGKSNHIPRKGFLIMYKLPRPI